MAQENNFNIENASIMNSKQLNTLLGLIAVSNRRIWKAAFDKNIVTIYDKCEKELFKVNTRGNKQLKDQLICAYTDNTSEMHIKLTVLPGDSAFSVATDNLGNDILIQLHIDRIYGDARTNDIKVDCHDINGNTYKDIPQEVLIIDYHDAKNIFIDKELYEHKGFKKEIRKKIKYYYLATFGIKFNEKFNLGDTYGHKNHGLDTAILDTKVHDIHIDLTEDNIKNNDLYAMGCTIGNFVLGKREKYLHHLTSIRTDCISLNNKPMMSHNNKQLVVMSDYVESTMQITNI